MKSYSLYFNRSQKQTQNKIYDKTIISIFFLIGFTFISCKESSSNHNQVKQQINDHKITHLIDSLVVYKTDDLIIKKLSNHIYEHISFLKTNDFGKVACNGMLVINENKGVIFDTPTDNKSSLELMNFITNELKCEITAIIPTHFHKDCIGGIDEFEKLNIPTYATSQTIDLIKQNGKKFSKPINEFNNNLSLNIGNKKVYAEYYGEGHTKDNIIGYFPDDNAIFGGCLIKEVGAGKGNLEDANTNNWSETVRKIKTKYPEIEIVIPGHGALGGAELFDYTIELFKTK